MLSRNRLCFAILTFSLIGFVIIGRHLAVSRITQVESDHTRGGGLKGSVAAIAKEHASGGIATNKDWGKEGEEEWVRENVRLLEGDDMVEGEGGRVLEPLKKMCKKIKWKEGLVFECLTSGVGDIGVLRSEILTCIHYTLTSGASLILPGTEPPTSIRPKTPIDRIFNTTLLQKRLRSACPQMKIYTSEEPGELDGPVIQMTALRPEDLPHYRGHPVKGIANYVHSLADANMGAYLLIPFGPVSNYYPVCSDDTDFVDTFGDILPFARPLLQLASSALWSMRQNFSMPLEPGMVQHGPPETNDKSRFLGVDLDTFTPEILEQKDAELLKIWEYYLRRMAKPRHGSYNLPLIYAATQQEDSITKFEKRIASSPNSFGDKTPQVIAAPDLLDSEDLARWNGLDEQDKVVVDYLILLRSHYFLGTAESRVSWMTAIKRRAQSTSGSCGWHKPWTRWLWSSALWDEYSDVMGKRGHVEEDTSWP